MPADINSVFLIGRLTRESEYRVSQNGGAVVRFSIAVNRRKRTGENAWEDEANFFNCVYMGRAAESINQYLEKGRQVAIQGELRQNRWTDQQGQARSTVEIFVNNLELLASPQGSQRGASALSSNNWNQGGSSSYSKPSTPQNSSRGQAGSYTMKSSSGGDLPDFNVGPEQFSDDDVPF